MEVLKFGADWCAPCKLLDRNLEGKEYVKINVDDNMEEVIKYNVRNVPTTLFIKNGEVIERKVGVFTVEEFDLILERYNDETKH